MESLKSKKASDVNLIKLVKACAETFMTLEHTQGPLSACYVCLITQCPKPFRPCIKPVSSGFLLE